MRGILYLLPDSHGVAPRHAILALGVTARELDAARRTGAIVGVRRGWYADPGAEPRVVTATRIGGSLTCVSALELAGLWVQPPRHVHVSVGRNASRLRPASGARVHWSSTPGPRERSVDSVAEALAVASGCLSREFALVAIDCALNRGVVSMRELRLAFAGCPGEGLLRSADRGSQSGLETLSRVRLRSKNVRLRTQVKIAGVGWVDVLIGERLVLELDGYGFHATGESFEKDRRRDLALQALGYRVVRLSYRQVMYEWAAAEKVILAMIRRGDHRWPRRRTQDHGADDRNNPSSGARS